MAASRGSDGRGRPRTQSRVTAIVYKIGDLIDGRYRVRDLVGSGGAGVVYRADDEGDGGEVAVKVINAKLVQTPDDQRLFARQVKLAARVSHPNVVEILGEGREEASPYIVMRHLEGLSLRKIIDLRKDKGQVFSLAEVEPILRQLAQAVDFAHATTFHGDLKPENVIVLPDLLKITDFPLLRGLPRKPFLAIQKQRGPSYRYLAPEVRNEVADIGPATDVYSLGVILGEMLTGVVHDDAKPDLLRRSAEALEPAVATALMRALSRSAKDRPSSARALMAEIEAARGPAAPKTVAEPVVPEDDPTQRLDIEKHGLPPSALQGGREASGSFSVDDEMIESASPARRDAPRTILREEGKPVPPQMPAVGPRMGGSSADLIDAGPADDGPLPSIGPDDEEEATEAALDVVQALQSIGGGLEELSASSIEMLDEPGLVIVRRDESVPDQPSVADGPRTELSPPGATHSPTGTLIPEPLADGSDTIERPPVGASAPSEAAFANGEATAFGRLDEPRVPAVPSSNAAEVVAALDGVSPGPSSSPERPRTRPRTVARAAVVPDKGFAKQKPTGVMDRPRKERPMTRPRVSTMGLATGVPSLIDVPAPVLPTQTPQPVGDDGSRWRWIALAAGALGLLLLVGVFWLVFGMIAKQNEVIERQNALLIAAQERVADARKTTAQAESEEEAAAAAAAAAEREAAEAEAKKRAEAEAEARAEAAKLAAEEEAKRAADAAARSAAEERAREAAKEAAQRSAARADAERAADAAKARAERERAARAAAAERAAEARAAEARAERARAEAERRARRARAAEEAEAARAAAEEAEAEREVVVARTAPVETTRRGPVTSASSDTPSPTRTAEPKPTEPSTGASAAALAPPPAGGLECPKAMTLVDAGSFMMGAPRNDPERNFGDQDHHSVEVAAFCIDYYEYPNSRGREPTADVSWGAADARCKRRGKRLCTEEEWEKACKGPGGSRYPYGSTWDAARCNTEDEEGGDREIVGSGTFRTCRSGYNVYDMGGNVAEWTSSKKGSSYVIKGGSSDRPGYDSRCAARRARSASSAKANVGFRCCADPN